MVYKFCDKKSMGSGTVKPTTKSSSLERSSSERIMKNSSLILVEELHKPVIKKFNKRKVYSQFKDNIWGVDLPDMKLLSKQNKGIKYLLCAIDLFSKYAFVVPLKDKKGINIVNAFDKIIKQSGKKPNNIWVDQGSEFYNRDFKERLSSNNIIMYSTYNEGESVVAERCIRTLKNKLYKHMTATGKNVYYDVLDDVFNKYNNTWHNSIKMKPIDVKNNERVSVYDTSASHVYIDEHNEKSARFNVMIELEYLNLRIYLLKDILLIGVTKYLLLIK